MKLKATLMRWSPGTTPRMVGVVALPVLGLAVEPEPLPPPHAVSTREKAMQKNEFLSNMNFMFQPSFSSLIILKIYKTFANAF
jgi:hypothetical protein